jgi:uncharacterized protein YfbU (UPF0304 family)
MRLSGAEKLILIMLCEIYEKLGIEAEIDPKFVKQAIFANQIWGLEWKFPGIFAGEESTDPPIVVKVVDILDMWSIIESAYDNLSDQEKETLKREAKPFGDNVMFQGFDANNEDEYSVARFLIEDLERFSSFKGRSLNTHFPVIDTYRRMLAVFTPIRKKLDLHHPLNVKELTEILKAQEYPK